MCKEENKLSTEDEKARIEVIMKIIERAKELGITNPKDTKMDILMDLRSADKYFNMRLNDWLNADEFNFAHDFTGIQSHITRDKFPCEDFKLFVPRFAGKSNK